jgi:small-conductance mechanosensitive channel
MFPARHPLFLAVAFALAGGVIDFPKTREEAQSRRAEAVKNAEDAEKLSTHRGLAALDEARIQHGLVDTFDDIAALLRREEELAKDRSELPARRAAADATIKSEEALAARTPTKPEPPTEAHINDLQVALDRARGERAELVARLAAAERLGAGGSLAERERARAAGSAVERAARALQLGTSALGPRARAVEQERVALAAELQTRTLRMLDASEDAAPEAIAVLTLERHAKNLEIARRERELTASIGAHVGGLTAELAAAEKGAAALETQRSNTNDPHEREILGIEARTAAARIAALTDRLDSAQTVLESAPSGRLIEERARFDTLRADLDAREAGGDTTGFDETFRSIVRVRKSKDLLDLRDETPQLRDMASRERAAAGGALRDVTRLQEDRETDLARFEAAVAAAPEASRASLVSRYDAAQAALIDATQARALAASRAADLASARLRTIGQLFDTVDEELSMVGSRALFVRVASRVDLSSVGRAAGDALALIESAPAGLAAMGGRAGDFLRNRDNLPRILLAAVLLPAALALVFVTRRVALRLSAKLPAGAELPLVARAERLGVGVARRAAFVGFVVLAAVIGVRIFAAPAALVRAVDGAAIAVLLVRFAYVLVVALLRPDDARLRLLPVRDDTARYVWRVALLASLALLVIAVPRQILEAIGYGAINPEFMGLLALVERALVTLALVALFLRKSILEDLLPQGRGAPLWKLVRSVILWLRPLILGFALSIVGLRILGFEFFAAHVESISLGGVAVVGLASLGFRALMELWDRLAPRLNLGPAGSELALRRRQFLDRFVRVLASIAFVVAAYAAFVVVVRVGRADPTAVDVGVVGGHRFTLVDLARFVIAVLATIVAAAWVRKGLELFLLPLTKMDLGTRYAVAVASSYGVLAVGSVVSLTQLGLALGDFAILLGAAGFGIGLGLQETASNFMNGLILLFSRPVKVGDVIESEGRTGTIADISISSTLLITPENHEIRIPNREIIGKRLVNYTGRDPKVRGTCKVGIGYGSDLDKARRILIEVASKTPGVFAFPEMQVVLLGFGASSVDLELRFWVPVDLRGDIESQVRFAALPALTAAGIEVPFPQQEIRVKGPIEIRRD